MNIITRRLEFDAGHRVLGHESKCANLHGHRYVAEVSVTPKKDLDKLGRVIDYGVIKQVVGQWIDEYWDHTMLLHPDDPLIKAVRVLNKHQPIEHEAVGWENVLFGPFKDAYIMQEYGNPTAENIAHELFDIATRLLVAHPVAVMQVRIFETPNCWADWFGTPGG